MPHQQVIQRLKPHVQAIKGLREQTVPVGRFLLCYERLLHDKSAWMDAKRLLGNHAYISRSRLREVASLCNKGEETWAALFVLTMMWGYGESDDSGPVKLFFALGFTDHGKVIEQTAMETLAGKLALALHRVQVLPEIGSSYATKFLFAAASASAHSPSTLVLDDRIVGAVRRLWGEETANELFHLKARRSKSVKGMKKAGEGYLAYCEAMGAVATALSVEPAKLEQFLFENAKNL